MTPTEILDDLNQIAAAAKELSLAISHDDKLAAAEYNHNPAWVPMRSKKPDIIRQLVAERKRLGISQEEVGFRMGSCAGQQTVCHVEKCRHMPKLSTLERYADALGMRIEFRLVPRKERVEANAA